MTTAWAHLPNAKHIDKMFASLKAHPEEWVKAYRSARGLSGASYAAVMAMDRCGQLATYEAELAAVRVAAYGAAYDAGSYTILALIAYDDSAHLLDSTPEEIKILNALGHPYAILFLPAAMAFQQINSP